MKPGRNEPCPCRSGKKYKKCCATHTVGVPEVEPHAPLSNESLLRIYTEKPSHHLARLLRVRLGNNLLIEKLFEASAKSPSNAQYLLHLVDALIIEDRYLESAHFCRRLIEIDPRPEHWYICGIIASFRNDLSTLNQVLNRFLSPGTADRRAIIIHTAALYCVGNVAAAIEKCLLALKEFPQEPFCIELACCIASDSKNMHLAQEVALTGGVDRLLKHSSRLFRQIDQLNRMALLFIVKEKIAHE